MRNLYNQTKNVHPALFYARLFDNVFFFNAPCKFTPLLNSRSLIFGLTLCDWLRSITLTPYFDRSIVFDLRPFT